MAGGDDRHQLVAHRIVVEAASVLVARREQKGEHVVVAVGLRPARADVSVQQLVDDAEARREPRALA